MKFEIFLYSRTLSADYRWIIRSALLSSQEMQVLENFLDLYKRYRFVYAQAKLNPFFCMKFSSALALFTLQNGVYKDEFGRDIYAIQGICADHTYQQALWEKMPEIVNDYDDVLHVWRYFTFENADDLVNKASGSYSFDKLFPKQKTRKTVNSEVSLDTSELAEPVILPFNKTGLNKLNGIIRSQSLPPSEIAFGCTPEMVNKDASFRIFAYVNEKWSKDAQELKRGVSQKRGKRRKTSKQKRSEKKETLTAERFNPVFKRIDKEEQKLLKKKYVSPDQKIKEIIDILISFFRKK